MALLFISLIPIPLSDHILIKLLIFFRVLQSLRRRVASCENTADITSNQSGDITNNSDDILAKQVTPLSRDDHSTNDKLGAQVLDNIKKEELLKNLPKGMNTSEISKYICEKYLLLSILNFTRTIIP